MTYRRLTILCGTALWLGACGDDGSAQAGTATDAASSSSGTPTTTVTSTSTPADSSTSQGSTGDASTSTTGSTGVAGSESSGGASTSGTSEGTSGASSSSGEGPSTGTGSSGNDTTTSVVEPTEGSSSSAAAASSSSTGDPSCGVEDLGSALPATALIDTSGAGDDFTPCAGPGGADDVALRWTAPAAGTYMFTTRRPGTVVGDTIVTVLDGDCDGAVLDCDDDISGISFRSLASASLVAGQSVVVVVDGYNATYVGAVELYIDALPVGNAGGSCCGASAMGGCDTAAVEACVCSFAPECCENAWTPQCANVVSTECLAECSCIEFNGCDAPFDDCICQGCNVDGVCDEQDDCIGCVDCEGDPQCGCNSDGVCEVYNESCACADCANEVVCTG